MRSASNRFADEHMLVCAAQHGDLDAFNQLILRYQDLLYRIAFRILHDEDAAADALQEALISAFRKFHTFRGGSLRSWLARVTVNACYDEMRQRRRQRSVPLQHLNPAGEEIDTAYWLVDHNAGPEERYETLELDRALQESLHGLVPIYRTVLVLVDIEGMSYEEAAAITGIPIGTVKSRLARARIQVQHALRAHGDLLPAPYRLDIPISL